LGSFIRTTQLTNLWCGYHTTGKNSNKQTIRTKQTLSFALMMVTPTLLTHTVWR